jgi:hypothetical protein
MSATSLATGVAALLASDATLQAELTTLLGFGVSRVIKSNQPAAQIPDGMLPAWVMEQAPGETDSRDSDDGLTIGHARQAFASELDVAMIWTNPDRETAFDQRSALSELLAQLFMRNPQPGGVGLAFLARWEPDQSIFHPRQVFAFTVRGEYTIYRS